MTSLCHSPVESMGRNKVPLMYHARAGLSSVNAACAVSRKPHGVDERMLSLLCRGRGKSDKLSRGRWTLVHSLWPATASPMKVQAFGLTGHMVVGHAPGPFPSPILYFICDFLPEQRVNFQTSAKAFQWHVSSPETPDNRRANSVSKRKGDASEQASATRERFSHTF